MEIVLRLADSEPFVSKVLLTEAYRALDDPAISESLTLDDLEGRMQGNRRLVIALEELRTPTPFRKEHLRWEQEHQERLVEYERSKRQR
ncbi:MAG: hypothetical protein F4X48_03535 [Acidimicrobiia bacterium]|nr:hypothetical protein [Acidimicrobiia bacterium]MYC57646.1 hypothetical protein [Acidimicrobiia bacterium]